MGAHPDVANVGLILFEKLIESIKQVINSLGYPMSNFTNHALVEQICNKRAILDSVPRNEFVS